MYLQLGAKYKQLNILVYLLIYLWLGAKKSKYKKGVFNLVTGNKDYFIC